jgi:dihydrofolate reductase
MINIIAACCSNNNGIGYKGNLPWKYIKEDMIHFKQMTTNKTIIMGRCTWESIKQQPLKNRKNIVLTSKNNIKVPQEVTIYNNFDDVIKDYIDKEIWVIGGEKLYKQALEHPNFNTLYLTRIMKDYPCDRFFPSIPKIYKKITINKIIINENIELIFEKYINNK